MNDTDEMKSVMQKVHSHDQEQWMLTHTRCSCGTAYSRKSVIRQRVESREEVPADVLTVMCLQCGTVSELAFDISSFHGKPNVLALDELIGDRDRIFDMYVSWELRMESVVNYLRELAKRGDSLALEYLADRVRHSLDAVKSRGER
jgi:hypothetical protein